MLLNQLENNNSKHNCMYYGLVWFSMVYHIINISIHNIVSINPLNHNMYMVTCVNKTVVNTPLTCVVYLENWFSGLVRLLLSNTLYHTKPAVSHDTESQWFTSLDSIGVIRFCH